MCTHLVAACSSSWGWHSNTWTTGKYKSNSWIYSCIPHNWLLGIIPVQLTQNWLLGIIPVQLTQNWLLGIIPVQLMQNWLLGIIPVQLTQNWLLGIIPVQLTQNWLLGIIPVQLTQNWLLGIIPVQLMQNWLLGIIPVQLTQNWLLHKSYWYNWVYQVDKSDNQAKSQLQFHLFCSAPSPSVYLPVWSHALTGHVTCTCISITMTMNKLLHHRLHWFQTLMP